MKYRNNHKPVKLIALTLLLLLICFAGYKVYAHYHQSSPVALSPGPTSKESKQAAEIDAKNKKALEGTPAPNSAEQTQTTTSPTPPSSDTIELLAKQETSPNVTVITKLPGVSSGTCNLIVVNGTKTITKTADVIFQPEFSSCAGFSIPISELGTGNWNINLSVSIGSSTASKSTTLKVN